MMLCKLPIRAAGVQHGCSLCAEQAATLHAGCWVPACPGAAPGKGQLGAAADRTVRAACSQLLSFPRAPQTPFPTRQWAPSLHRSSRGWDPLAPLSCAGSAPRCEERSWERRSGCGAELCCCLDNAFRLSPALTGRLGKEGGQIWAVGQPSVLVRCARPGTGGLLALQVASDLAVRCYCQHQKRSLGLCTYVDPDIKEINFDLFHIKTSHAEEGKEERIWDSPCPWTAVILLERKSSFLWA